jgi:hypothetical protein
VCGLWGRRGWWFGDGDIPRSALYSVRLWTPTFIPKGQVILSPCELIWTHVALMTCYCYCMFRTIILNKSLAEKVISYLKTYGKECFQIKFYFVPKLRNFGFKLLVILAISYLLILVKTVNKLLTVIANNRRKRGKLTQVDRFYQS